jgi:hypothetical protein
MQRVERLTGLSQGSGIGEKEKARLEVVTTQVAGGGGDLALKRLYRLYDA